MEEFCRFCEHARGCVAKETIDFVPAEAARVSLLEDVTESCRHLESCNVEAGVTLPIPRRAKMLARAWQR